MGVRWRLCRTDRSGGRYYVLQKGRARDRVGLTLGYLEAPAAERALEQIQSEEDAGTVRRVLLTYERNREDAVRYLCGDPEVEAIVGPGEPDYGSMRLREYFDTVYAEAREQERPRGWASEKRHWKLLLDGIGEVRLRSVDEFVLADHLDQMAVTRGKRQGEPASGTTRRLQRAALAAMLKWAYRRKHVARVPDLAVFRIEGATKTVRDKPDPLTLDELVAVLGAATERRHRALFAVGAGQGLRPSELVALDWADVDWDVPAMRVRGTKTAASADTIPITPLALRELRAWWERCGRPVAGLIFPNDDGVKYASATGYKKALETAARRAGIERGVNPYLLRDSFATIAWAVGIERDVARRVLRHTDDRMLDRVYCRPRPAELVAKVAAFDRVDPDGADEDGDGR